MGHRFHHLNREQVQSTSPLPERNLLLAVLRRAILDFRGTDPELAQQAREWFQEEFSPGEALPEFSFQWICQELTLQPSAIYEILRNAFPLEEEAWIE